MKTYRVKLTALDGKFITPRTGTDSQEGNLVVNKIDENTKYEHGNFIIYWTQDCPGASPGVAIAVRDIKKIDDNTYEFKDYERRPFRLEYLVNVMEIS